MTCNVSWLWGQGSRQTSTPQATRGSSPAASEPDRKDPRALLISWEIWGLGALRLRFCLWGALASFHHGSFRVAGPKRHRLAPEMNSNFPSSQGQALSPQRRLCPPTQQALRIQRGGRWAQLPDTAAAESVCPLVNHQTGCGNLCLFPLVQIPRIGIAASKLLLI